MKTAVIIDYEKIERIKKQLEDPQYIENAIDSLSGEILWLFE